MFNYSKRKLFILALTLGLFFTQAQSAFAVYETIKAKTVGNENIKKEKKDDYLPTYNDPELPQFSPDDCVTSKVEKKINNFLNRKKKKSEPLPSQEIQNEDLKEEVFAAPKKQQQEAVNDKNRFQINADKITYDDTEGNVYAKGNVEIISKAQGITLKADDAVLDKTDQTLKLHNNVRIIKEGTEMFGEYMLVNLNEQNILMDDPTLEAYSFVVKAQEGYLIANDIQMVNGTIKNSKKGEFPFATNGFHKLEPGGAINLYDAALDDSALNPNKKKQVYTINAKEIVITSYRDHDSILLKGSNVLYNNHKILHNSDIEIISDKQNQVIETSAPEAGTLRNFGTYIGYGFVNKLPKGQTLKLMPALVYKSGIGVGIIGRHQSQNSSLEAGWATSSSDLVVRGRYRLGDGLNLRYGRHAYLSEGFLGARRSGYAAQLEYMKSYKIKDLEADFSQGVYAGIFSDYEKHNQEEAYATTRFRYMAQLSKTFLRYENKEQDLKIAFRGMAQAAATLYGSGETMGIARIGPFINTKLKRWESTLGYLFAGVHGDSPFVFDKYRYGKSSIMLNEKFNFSNRFALGYKATVTPLKDNYEDDLLTESRLYAMFGPQDLKIALSYDFVRDIAHLEFLFLLGSDSAKINFEKLTTKDMDGGQAKRDFYKRNKRINIEDDEDIQSL